jgi:ribosomal-protein-alanine N-acetyltransferase
VSDEDTSLIGTLKSSYMMSPEIHINDLYQSFAVTSINQNQYKIRPMLETDIATVVQIEQTTWGDESWSLDDFFRALDNPFSNCWILESTIKGYSVLGYGLQYVSGNVSHIANLCIRPSHCGYGLGKVLLHYLIDYARQKGASKIQLVVHTSNIRAYTLYSNHGFRILQLLPQYYSDQSDAYKMVLLL